ncbi:hypothetical protein K440DRAFT_658427 [Wilcoxina mikolae CBS 423.85]|nr:hypothetical protein K440DRAFT_658427 [Wilcoxina mikolae CBS 423.85]
MSTPAPELPSGFVAVAEATFEGSNLKRIIRGCNCLVPRRSILTYQDMCRLLKKRFGLSSPPDAIHLNCQLSLDSQNESVVVLDFQNNWAELAESMSFDRIYVVISVGRVNDARYGDPPGDESTRYRLVLSKARGQKRGE